MTGARIDPFAFPVLMGDIGGTNVRFSLLSDAFAEPRPFEPVSTADFPNIETAIQTVVCDMTSTIPRSAVIAAAGPVTGDELELTNAAWQIRPRDMMDRIGLSDVVLLNDFEAQALAVTALNDEDIHPVGSGTPVPGGARLIIGPGTGLGVAGLLNVDGLWIPVPGEGGHISFGPMEPDEYPVFESLIADQPQLSAESVLAGRGIVRLYSALAVVSGREVTFSEPDQITEAALTGADALATETIALYCRLLGRAAGDLALIFMATGGVFVGGGIVPRILPLLNQSEFRRAFESKWPHATLMAEIPTAVVTAPRAAMHGLSAFARTPSRFGMSLSGRRWRD